MSPDETRRKRLAQLQHLLGSMSVPDKTEYALSWIVRDLITVVTDADRDRAYDIEMERRNHDALDGRVAKLVERVEALEDRVADLAQDVEGLSRFRPAKWLTGIAAPVFDDDRLDLDALPVGTMLRDRNELWWFRELTGWRVLSGSGRSWPADSDPSAFLAECGPFEVVHRG